MQTYRMIVKTEGTTGKTNREITRHLTEDQVPEARRVARENAPAGATRTIKVLPED